MLATLRNANLAFVQPTCWRAGALQTKGQEAGPLGWHHPVGRIQTHNLFKLRVSEENLCWLQAWKPRKAEGDADSGCKGPEMQLPDCWHVQPLVIFE